VLLLGLDTATAVTTVALVRSTPDGAVHVLGERSHLDPRRHGEVLPVQIDEVLRDAGVAPSDLDAVAVGVGPGAFTGLRVGLATAQALGLALHVPVLGVGTLDHLAFATGRCEPFAVATDARRRELFWATYSGMESRTTGPMVGSPEAVRDALRGLPVVCPPGTPDVAGVDVVAGEHPRGVALCRLVLARIRQGSDHEAPTPLYLRRPDVSPAGAPKSVLR
jgi:tRNA threonylcarbamoyl adenosine modification protein YeaZ